MIATSVSRDIYNYVCKSEWLHCIRVVSRFLAMAGLYSCRITFSWNTWTLFVSDSRMTLVAFKSALRCTQICILPATPLRQVCAQHGSLKRKIKLRCSSSRGSEHTVDCFQFCFVFPQESEDLHWIGGSASVAKCPGWNLFPHMQDRQGL